VASGVPIRSLSSPPSSVSSLSEGSKTGCVKAACYTCIQIPTCKSCRHRRPRATHLGGRSMGG
jgi:hypothetical protein